MGQILPFCGKSYYNAILIHPALTAYCKYIYTDDGVVNYNLPILNGINKDLMRSIILDVPVVLPVNESIVTEARGLGARILRLKASDELMFHYVTNTLGGAVCWEDTKEIERLFQYPTMVVDGIRDLSRLEVTPQGFCVHPRY